MTKTFTKASIRAIIARVKEALEAEKDPAGRRRLERALDYWERRGNINNVGGKNISTSR